MVIYVFWLIIMGNTLERFLCHKNYTSKIFLVILDESSIFLWLCFLYILVRSTNWYQLIRFFKICRIKNESFEKNFFVRQKDRQLPAVTFLTTRKCLILFIRICLQLFWAELEDIYIRNLVLKYYWNWPSFEEIGQLREIHCT